MPGARVQVPQNADVEIPSVICVHFFHALRLTCKPNSTLGVDSIILLGPKMKKPVSKYGTQCHGQVDGTVFERYFKIQGTNKI